MKTYATIKENNMKGSILQKNDVEKFGISEIDLTCATVSEEGDRYYAYYPKFKNVVPGKNFVQCCFFDPNEFEEVEITKFIKEEENGND